MKPLPPADGFLSKRQAAEYLSLSLRSLDYLVTRGALPAFKPPIAGQRGYKMLFKRTDLNSYVERYPASRDLDDIVDETVQAVTATKA